jgi:hypothetical protein
VARRPAGADDGGCGRVGGRAGAAGRPENGGTDATETITPSNAVLANDTITVEVERAAPGFFAKIFGIDSVTVHARATARTGNIGEAKYVAPIVVLEDYLDSLGCSYGSQSCNSPATLTLIDLHQPGGGNAAGNFGLIDLAGGNGSVGTGTLASWITEGYQDYLPAGSWYDAVPSTKFHSKQFKDAMKQVEGQPVLLPVYNQIVQGGSTADFYVIGWVGFVLDPGGYTTSGPNGQLTGRIVSVNWEGIQSTSGGNPGFGVRDIDLIQ